jgi:hypothetical protein
MSNQVKIDRCICLNTPFHELKDYDSVEQIKRETGCGTRCQMCSIYLDEMLETGQTEFNEPLY